MHTIEQSRTVTIIRPEGISPSAQLEHEIQSEVSGIKESFTYNELMPEIIANTRELIFEVAEDLDLEPIVYGYDSPEGTIVPSRKATQWILKETDVLAIFEPNDDQIAHAIACLLKKPAMSLILAATNKEYLEERMTIIETQMVRLLKGDKKYIPRIHPTGICWNREDEIIPTLKKALIYPYEAA